MCKYNMVAKKNQLCNFLQKKLEQTAKHSSTVKVNREKGECRGDLRKVQMV